MKKTEAIVCIALAIVLGLPFLAMCDAQDNPPAPPVSPFVQVIKSYHDTTWVDASSVTGATKEPALLYVGPDGGLYELTNSEKNREKKGNHVFWDVYFAGPNLGARFKTEAEADAAIKAVMEAAQ